MLHELLRLIRPLIVPDVETTGLNPLDSRIIELGFQLWTAEGLKIEWRTLVQPGIPIPPASTAVHHITDAMVAACRVCGGGPKETLQEDTCRCEEFKPWPTFKEIAPRLGKGFSDCDFAGKNVRFDLRIINAEMSRAEVEWSYMDARIIDADRLEQLGEPRDLASLYKKHTGKVLGNAHQALDDVRATTEVLTHQLQQYQTLPRSLDLLHDLQWPGWIDSEGKFRFVNGIACCMFGKWAGQPMTAIERGYWDYILRADFPSSVKSLASNAKLGVFPLVKER